MIRFSTFVFLVSTLVSSALASTPPSFSFHWANNIPVGSTPLSAAVADLNGDGFQDIVVANHASASVSVLLGTGNANFKKAVNYTVPAGPYAVAIGDFNGDGKLDLAVSSSSSKNVTILIGNGDGTFQTPGKSYATGGEAVAIVAGDFNGDGKLDLVTANYDTGTTGAVTYSIAYNTFGYTTYTSGSGSIQERYTAREYESDTYLNHYRARYYDSQVGRFIGEDPIRFKGGVDYYPYAGNNPATFMDPTGQKSCCNQPCLVDVRCWPIQKFNLGALGFRHCFLTVRNKNCEVRDVSGGPENGRLREWDTPATPQPTAVTYQRALVPCNMVDCLERMAPIISGMNLPYLSGSQNSNTAFATALSACGLSDLISYAPPGAVGTHPLPGAGGGW